MTRQKNDAPLSARERQVWHAVKTLSEVAFSVVVREVESAAGMSSPDFAVLSRLEELGNGQVSQKKLADSLSWDKSRLSHHLTRMEARNLLVRKPSAEGPGVELEILPEGRKAIAAARPVHARAIRTHILRFVSAENSNALIALAQHLKDAQ